MITSIDADSDVDEPLTACELELVRIDEALEELEARDPALAELVQLRYFCGLSLARSRRCAA